MKYKIFTIPVLFSDDHIDDLNKFLRTVRVVHVEHSLVTDNNSPIASYRWVRSKQGD